MDLEEVRVKAGVEQDIKSGKDEVVDEAGVFVIVL